MSNEIINSAEAIEKIEELAYKAKDVRTYTAEDGSVYLLSTNEKGEPVYCLLPAEHINYPQSMHVNTLEAFVRFIRAGLMLKEIPNEIYINIVSPTKVCAYTLLDKRGRRSEVAEATRYNLQGFSFGNPYGFEDFVVSLRSKFVPSEESNKLLSCLKAVTKSNDISTEDNGITQVVTAKSGVNLGSVTVNPVWGLKPYRTFTEVEQPTSLFLLRLTPRGDETVYTLHETDGGAWAITAMSEIKKYLLENLKEEIDAGNIYIL